MRTPWLQISWLVVLCLHAAYVYNPSDIEEMDIMNNETLLHMYHDCIVNRKTKEKAHFKSELTIFCDVL